MNVARHVQSTQNMKLGFMFYCYAKHSDILLGSSHDGCYLFPRNLETANQVAFLKCPHLLEEIFVEFNF